MDERLNEVARLWDEHMEREFPADIRGVEFGDIDMVLLDADLAGCVISWLGDGGTLDGQRQEILASCLADLDSVLPGLAGEESIAYFTRLREVASLVAADRGAADNTTA